MLNLKQQVFGEKGYTADMRLTDAELDLFRGLIGAQWLEVISAAYPELHNEASRIGIKNYHQISDLLDHKRIWPKCNRVLPQTSVAKLRALPFFGRLKDEFGEFAVSDVFDVERHPGSEEVYWRLVRPEMEEDVGTLHADKWFHSALGMENGMFPPGAVTVKIWIAIYCEPGKNGLAIVGGSHLRDWKFHVEEKYGGRKPVIDEEVSTLDAKLINTAPGDLLLFNERTLHAGVVNRGSTTRVSAEITMVLPQGAEWTRSSL